MTGRAGAVLSICLTACAGSAPPRPPAPSPERAAPSAAVRLVHSASDADFWALRTAREGLVVAGGARLRVAASGEVTEVAWDLPLAGRGDGLIGALAVPEPMGGGFVHWSRRRVFRSRSFTGPLDPVDVGDLAPGLRKGRGPIRGARVGPSSILVFTDLGPRALAPGATRLTPVAEPGMLDAALLTDGRAVRLDMFGRVFTSDDGARYTDLTPTLGLGARGLVVGERGLWVDTLHDHIPIERGGRIGEPAGRPMHQHTQFQTAWSTATDRPEPPWGLGSMSPIAAAVGSGGDAGDGTAFGFVQDAVVRVDLRTGALLAATGDWSPNGLLCQPVHARDAVLFACAWERYRGRGAYVLRSERGAPPVIEWSFSDEGVYVSDDEGALGYVGSCHAEPGFYDPEVMMRSSDGPAEVPLASVLCVRRGRGDWVERRIDLASGETMVAWVPGADGRAAAIVTTSDPLPPPASPSGRASVRAGVRVVNVERELRGWAIPRTAPIAETGPSFVDRRFHLRDDGSIDVWLSPVQDASPQVTTGGSIDPRGALTIHPAAPSMIAAIGAGPFGVSLSADGVLYETVDRGRTHRRAGKSPVPPSAFASASCSSLGCALGPIVRLGWGAGAIAPTVRTSPLPEAPPPRPVRRLSCAPSGAPTPLPPSHEVPSNARSSVHTGWGDSLEVIRDASAREPARADAKKRAQASPAVTRTHTLVTRTPFTVRGAAKRINATDAPRNLHRHTAVTPLLGPRGDVQMLVAGDGAELLIEGDRATVLPSVDTRRYGRRGPVAPAGLVATKGRPLLLVDTHRRLALEERGSRESPLLLGVEPESQRRQPMLLGRRDDGAVAVLVLDGPAPGTAGAAIVDRVAGVAGPLVPLAPWSSLASADDAACRRGADPGAFEALVIVDPRAWITLDPVSLAGLELGTQGLLLVRWGRARVCLEALDVGLVDRRARGAASRSFRLVARWAGEGERGAALRAPDLRQDLACRIDAAPRAAR